MEGLAVATGSPRWLPDRTEGGLLPMEPSVVKTAVARSGRLTRINHSRGAVRSACPRRRSHADAVFAHDARDISFALSLD
jgi:hypothetical protein